METQTILEQIFALQDLDYRTFNAKLIPTVDPEKVIGVRTPALRDLAKKLKGTPEAEAFLDSLPHTYFEENNLHGFLISLEKDYDRCLARLQAFVPYMDNWATCDQTSPKVLKKDLPRLLPVIETWLASDHPYTVRYGIGLLMAFYLDGAFDPVYLDRVAATQSAEYYVQMMQAWYFATALAKQYEATIPYLTEGRLEKWVHNKTIQKAVESFRITPEQKAYLKTLRQK